MSESTLSSLVQSVVQLIGFILIYHKANQSLRASNSSLTHIEKLNAKLIDIEHGEYAVGRSITVAKPKDQSEQPP